MQTQPVQAAPTPALSPSPAALAANEINLILRGGFVQIEARLDLDGLGELEEKLAALKLLMKPRKNDASPLVVEHSAWKPGTPPPPGGKEESGP